MSRVSDELDEALAKHPGLVRAGAGWGVMEWGGQWGLVPEVKCVCILGAVLLDQPVLPSDHAVDVYIAHVRAAARLLNISYYHTTRIFRGFDNYHNNQNRFPEDPFYTAGYTIGHKLYLQQQAEAK